MRRETRGKKEKRKKERERERETKRKQKEFCKRVLEYAKVLYWSE